METKYKVLKEFGDLKEGEIFNGADFDDSEQDLQDLIDNGTLEVSTPETEPTPEVESEPTPEVESEPTPEVVTPKTYNGQIIISENPREVEGRTYRHIRIADGSEYDLTDEQYEREVI
jgi:hypothetical protein